MFEYGAYLTIALIARSFITSYLTHFRRTLVPETFCQGASILIKAPGESRSADVQRGKTMHAAFRNLPALPDQLIVAEQPLRLPSLNSATNICSKNERLSASLGWKVAPQQGSPSRALPLPAEPGSTAL